MSKKKNKQNKSPKKGRQAKKPDLPFKKKWLNNWAENRSIYLFWLGFGVFMLLFHFLTLEPFYEKSIQEPVGGFFAYLSSGVLNLLGQHTTSSGMNITSPAYSLLIQRGCDAITAIMLLSAGILMFPAASWREKWKGLAIGVLFLFALNIVRIVSLYFVGVHMPDYFEFMHIEFWQFTFIGLAMAYFISWLYQTSKTNTPRARDSHPSL